MRDEFQTHKLNTAGLAAVTAVGEVFSRALEELEGLVVVCDRVPMVTKLQEACYLAKRAVAGRRDYQEGYLPDFPVGMRVMYNNPDDPKYHTLRGVVTDVLGSVRGVKFYTYTWDYTCSVDNLVKA